MVIVIDVELFWLTKQLILGEGGSLTLWFDRCLEVTTIQLPTVSYFGDYLILYLVLCVNETNVKRSSQGVNVYLHHFIHIP